MRKLLLLVFVAALCVPSYGSILVYKTTATATVFTGDVREVSKDLGYLVLDVTTATQTVNSAQQITYGGTEQQTVVVSVTFTSSAGYIVADYSSGNTDAVLFGKAADGKAAGLTGEDVAKSLKGSMLIGLGTADLGSGTLTATLDAKKTKAANEAEDGIDAVVADIVTVLEDKYPDIITDTTPPEPNVMTWASEPNQTGTTTITMTASTATDALSGPVEYFFTNVTDTNHNSGWQSSATFLDEGLTPDTNYTYTVKARDSAPVPNETADSNQAIARTLRTEDPNCPKPNRMEWDVNGEPNAISDTAIEMSAALATDDQGIGGYYFTCANDANFNSGWKSATEDSTGWVASTRTYTATGLTAATSYVFTVKAKDNALVANVTADSNQASATTDADTTAPTPDPMTFATAPEANGATAIYMVATTATDAAAVDYNFACVLGSGHDSGWQASPIYEDTGLTANTEYGYRVQARDASLNTTVVSEIATATTALTIQQRIAAAVAARTGEAPVTVTIGAGTYSESIQINDPNVTLVGAGAAATIIEPGANFQQAIEVNDTNVTIDGFTIKHGTQAYTALLPEEHTIWVHANYSTIQNCTIDTNSGNYAGIFIGGRLTGVAKAGGTSIWDYNVPTPSKGHTIQNNTFHGLIAGEGRGIFAVKLSDDSLISGNTFLGDANDMTGGWSTPGNEGGVGTGIQIHSAQKGSGTHAVTVQNNTAQYLKYALLNFTTEVPYNDSVGYMYTQVEHCEVNDVLVTGNTASDLGQDGIHTNGVGISFKGGKKSDAYEPNTADLTIGTGKVTITGNTLYNNDMGINVDGPTSVLSAAYGCVLLAENILVGTDNAIYSNVTAGLYNGTTETNQDGGAKTINAELNWWGAASGPYAASNTLGAGNAVSASVDFDPWYITSAMDANSAD